MDINRSKFQGVINIIRFNWHFYIIAVVLIAVMMGIYPIISGYIQNVVFLGLVLTIFTLVSSLVISSYIYDFSGLYDLNWLPDLNRKTVLTINAGFDETSILIENKFNAIDLSIADFYNPINHTEISIERAQKIYPSHPKTTKISTTYLPYEENTFDTILLIFAAHEIRNQKERDTFFKELQRIMKQSGKIIIVEHLRDWKNSLAYTMGVFHFYSKKIWTKAFNNAQLVLKSEIKFTPFISIFKLKKDGITF